MVPADSNNGWGQLAKGVGSNQSWAEKEPIHCLLTTQMSIQCSEQGSSDDPDEGNHKDDINNSVRPLGYIGGSSKSVGRQGSNPSYRKTGNFGSKRKSTDDSSEHNSKGKRYKERYRKKKVEDDRLADAGFEIARCLAEETKWKMSKDEETEQCIARFAEFGIVDHDHDFCMSYMNVDYRRKWFLVNDRNEILKWIKRTIELGMQNSNPTSNTSVPVQ